MLLASLATLVALLWSQVVTTGVALGRVGPGGTPSAWSILALHLAGAGVVGALSGTLTARALRRRIDSRGAVTAFALVPALLTSAAQTATALTIGSAAVGAVAALAAMLLVGALLGAVVRRWGRAPAR